HDGDQLTSCNSGSRVQIDHAAANQRPILAVSVISRLLTHYIHFSFSTDDVWYGNSNVVSDPRASETSAASDMQLRFRPRFSVFMWPRAYPVLPGGRGNALPPASDTVIVS